MLIVIIYWIGQMGSKGKEKISFGIKKISNEFLSEENVQYKKKIIVWNRKIYRAHK